MQSLYRRKGKNFGWRSMLASDRYVQQIMSSHKEKENSVEEELDRRVLHGLGCEWQEALWVLDSSHKELMRKPLFSLRDMTSKLGYWSRERREICLNRNFVRNHPWDAVREVLLHEMAHQFAHEVLGAQHESPHGPNFLKACNLLHANPKASGEYKPLHDRIFRESSRSEDKIMVRIRKLMALAQSQNKHEAEAAVAKAHQLIAKYNLTLLSRCSHRNFVSLFCGKAALRHFREYYALARLLTDFYFVYGIWVPAYVMDKGRMGSVLEITGTVQNTKIAYYVYDFVQQFISSQWDEYNEDKGLNRYRKTDFATGIVQGFSSKLKSQSEGKRKVGDKRALIEIGDPLLKKYVAHKYPRTFSVRGKALRHDSNILKDGMHVGETLVISKGITEKASNKRFLIENKKAEFV